MKKHLMPVLETDEYKLLLQDSNSNNYDVFKKAKNSEEPIKICVLNVTFKYVKTYDGEKKGSETYDIELEVTETSKILSADEFKKMILSTIY